jgi:hypothetical protein
MQPVDKEFGVELPRDCMVSQKKATPFILKLYAF